VLIDLERAKTLLLSGEVVAIPTETVFGLAASVKCSQAIRQIYHLKNRPEDNPLILHFSDWEQAEEYVELFPEAQSLIVALAHYPATFILPAKSSVPLLGRAGLSTVACRVVEHPLTTTLLQQVGPCFAPSANISGRPSSTHPDHVEEDFGREFPVLYTSGLPESYGVESTILHYNVDTNLWEIARPGPTAVEDLNSVLGYQPKVLGRGSGEEEKSRVVCPGMLYRHYSPRAKLLLSAKPYQNEAPHVIGFEDRTYPGAQSLWCWGRSWEIDRVAQQLYSFLRRLDLEGIEEAWMDIDFSTDEIGLAVHERLLKAAFKE
jgi:L-threonylcarbamoyladenylate synthase